LNAGAEAEDAQANPERGDETPLSVSRPEASSRLLDVRGLRLQVAQIGNGALRMGSGREDESLVPRENFQPGVDVAHMVRTRFKLRYKSEVGAQEARAKIGDEFLARPFALVFVVAAEIAVEAVCRAGPVAVMPISA
jgi:hypothetical protein